MKRKTPYYEFDVEKFSSLLEHYSNIGDLFYPIKANSHELVLNRVILHGASFEVDTIMQAELLINKYHVSPNSILYSKPIRSMYDISLALRYGVRFFVIDSIEEYVKINQLCKSCRLLIRICINDIINNDYLELNKWGLAKTSIPNLIDNIENDGHEYMGLSFYIPSLVYSFENFSKALSYCAPYCYGKTINVGGGLDGWLADNRYIDFLNVIKEQHNIQQVIIEPGRNLLDPCFTIITTVVARRTQNGNEWLYIDSGVYAGLLDAALYEKSYNIVSEKSCDVLIDYYISGNTSDIRDNLGKHKLPNNILAGDTLKILDCGAYSLNMIMEFSGYNKIDVIKT